MAETKKVAAVKPAGKAEVVARPVATVAVKTPEKAVSTKEEAKVEVKPAAKTNEKAAAKAPVAKAPAAKAPAAKPAAAKAAPAAKTTAKPAAKAPVKKAAAKPAAKPAAKAPAKKAEGKQVINLQFAGKSYSVEDIVKIAADVWKYDLHKSDEAYESLELYVKPEESVAYYVFNGDVTGSFFI